MVQGLKLCESALVLTGANVLLQRRSRALEVHEGTRTCLEQLQQLVKPRHMWQVRRLKIKLRNLVLQPLPDMQRASQAALLVGAMLRPSLRPLTRTAGMAANRRDKGKVSRTQSLQLLHTEQNNP